MFIIDRVDECSGVAGSRGVGGETQYFSSYHCRAEGGDPGTDWGGAYGDTDCLETDAYVPVVVGEES